MATFPANCEFPARVVAIDVGGTKITGSIVRYDSAEAGPVVGDSRTVATEAMKGGASVLDKICSLACNLAACAPSSPLGIGVGTAEISPTRTTSCQVGADSRSHRHCMSALAFPPPF